MLRLRRLVAVGVALVVGIGCRTVSDTSGRQPLPSSPAPPEVAHFSDYEPDHPYNPTKVEGVFDRSDFVAPSGEGYKVEVRDFLVSPARPMAPVPLSGAALLEVRQGSGTATVSGEEIPLRPGTIFTVDQGEPLVITAKDEPLALRTWIVTKGEAQ